MTKQLIVEVDSKLDRSFRETVNRVHGVKRGSVRDSLAESIGDWVKKYACYKGELMPLVQNSTGDIQIAFKISDDLDRSFRETVGRVHGIKRGNIRDALVEAMKDWIEKYKGYQRFKQIPVSQQARVRGKHL